MFSFLYSNHFERLMLENVILLIKTMTPELIFVVFFLVISV